MIILDNLKKRVRHLRRETFALYLAARHPDTPWYAKVLVAGVVAYALSPIDLIPDFVPVLGYLDDLILIPLGIAVSIKMIPPHVFAECRARAQESMASGKPVNRIAAAVIIGIWLLFAALCTLWAYEAFAIREGKSADGESAWHHDFAKQPTRIQLAINLKTAKAPGLTIPQSLLPRAGEVVQ